MTYGTSKGEPVTDEQIERWAEEAEIGYDVDQILSRRSRGRPPMGSGAARVIPVRLDPELDRELAEHVAREGVTRSQVIRDALREYLAG